MTNGAEFQYTIPPKHEGLGQMAQAFLSVGSLAGALAREKRTKVNHPDGRPENVAEHSNMLAIIAPEIASQFYPELDPNLVARFAAIHDIVEAYVGDTPTHMISAKELAAKGKREARGLAQLVTDYADFPSLVKVVTSYEEQVIPEARFVRVVDKLMPLVVHYNDRGATVRGYTNPDEVFRNAHTRAITLREQFPEFEAVIDARLELGKLAAQIFFPGPPKAN